MGQNNSTFRENKGPKLYIQVKYRSIKKNKGLKHYILENIGVTLRSGKYRGQNST